ncbi:MAG: TolC family protein [Bacteroidetes bacterium]|nr:TolC family protein [Bacteroidota bacterium]MBS1541721.1 TolC family protein [Bacteroidota bacterium]
MKFSLFIVFNLVMISNLCHGQIDTLFLHKEISFPEYLESVGKGNLNYAVQKFNVDIAYAGIEIAKIFPNPELYYGYINMGQGRMKAGYGYSVNANTTLELGGKRKARVDLANNTVDLTRAQLDDFFRNLRADATLAFLNALSRHNSLRVMTNSYESINKLAVSDSIRFKLGSIMEIDAKQSRLEARYMLNSVIQSQSDWKVSLNNLNLLVGKRNIDTLLYPIGRFDQFDREFVYKDLIVTALNNRADLLAALKNKNVAASALRLAKANRMIDLGIVLGSNNTSVVTNFVEPTPSLTAVYGGITIPLKFSNNYKGDLRTAEYNIAQAELQYRQVELQVETDVAQAYSQYMAERKQVQQFQSGLLLEAKRVLDGKVYAYQRGKTSLLEVLNAQRTYNTIRMDYFTTLYSYASALVQLERAAGIWDINF